MKTKSSHTRISKNIRHITTTCDSIGWLYVDFTRNKINYNKCFVLSSLEDINKVLNEEAIPWRDNHPEFNKKNSRNKKSEEYSVPKIKKSTDKIKEIYGNIGKNIYIKNILVSNGIEYGISVYYLDKNINKRKSKSFRLNKLKKHSSDKIKTMVLSFRNAINCSVEKQPAILKAFSNYQRDIDRLLDWA